MPLPDEHLRYLWKDLRRYFAMAGDPGIVQKARMILFTEGIWILTSYRIGQWARFDLNLPVVKQILKVLTFFIHFGLQVLTKIEIPFDANIGPGFYIGHSGYIIVHFQARIGKNCNISPGVIIGEGGRGDRRGVPVIGDRVYMAPGAKIIGLITIGDGAAIGANAVVSRDVPENAVVGGVPATILNSRGSGDFIVTDEKL